MYILMDEYDDDEIRLNVAEAFEIYGVMYHHNYRNGS